MCHESEQEVKAILEGTKNSSLKSSIIIIAQKQDLNFKNIERQLIEIKSIIISNNTESDKRLNKAIQDRKNDCFEHKKEINAKFKEIDSTTEELNFFKKHPKLLLIIGIGIVFLVGYGFGEKAIDILKLLK